MQILIHGTSWFGEICSMIYSEWKSIQLHFNFLFMSLGFCVWIFVGTTIVINFYKSIWVGYPKLSVLAHKADRELTSG